MTEDARAEASNLFRVRARSAPALTAKALLRAIATLHSRFQPNVSDAQAYWAAVELGVRETDFHSLLAAIQRTWPGIKVDTTKHPILVVNGIPTEGGTIELATALALIALLSPSGSGQYQVLAQDGFDEILRLLTPQSASALKSELAGDGQSASP